MRYAIFGTGRLAASLAPYLRRLGHETTLVPRRDGEAKTEAARRAVAAADVVAAAVPDRAILAWRDLWAPEIAGKTALHFSGALAAPGLVGAHPLCAFPKTPLAFEQMRAVAFAMQEGAPPLAAIFPGADNPTFVVADADRAFYHALAVLSGNFATHVWNETAKAMEDRLGLDAATVLGPYLAGVAERFAESPRDSLTGPLARRDRPSAEANLAALAEAPRLAALYRAFLASAWPDFDKK